MPVCGGSVLSDVLTFEGPPLLDTCFWIYCFECPPVASLMQGVAWSRASLGCCRARRFCTSDESVTRILMSSSKYTSSRSPSLYLICHIVHCPILRVPLCIYVMVL